MDKLDFVEFLLRTEQNVPGYHLDGNTDQSGGGYLDSQQTGTETKGTSQNVDNAGLSLYSTDLGLPTRIERGRVVRNVADRPKYRLDFQDGGYVEFDRQDWYHVTKGKTDIHDIHPGDRVDVEYYANRNDNSTAPQKIISVLVY